MEVNRISFDRASDFYDATRAMPPEMENAVIKALIEFAGIEHFNRVLELGVGTGRIAGPISEKITTRYVGIDISSKMMRKIREKNFNKVSPVQGDVCALPFKSGAFDVVLAVHVFHLVKDWRFSVQEAVRVLADGGVMMVAGEAATGHNPMEVITCGMKPEAKDDLFSVFQKYNLTHKVVGMNNMDEAAHFLQKMGACVTLPPTIEHTIDLPLAVIPGLMRGRVFSYLWETPEETLSKAVSDISRLIEKHYGSLEAKMPLIRKFQLVRAAF